MTHMKLFFITVAVSAFIGIIAAMAISDNKLVAQVQAGEVTLSCYMYGGEREIDPKKVVDFYPDQSYWVFTNGGSSTCEVIQQPYQQSLN